MTPAASQFDQEDSMVAKQLQTREAPSAAATASLFIPKPRSGRRGAGPTTGGAGGHLTQEVLPETDCLTIVKERQNGTSLEEEIKALDIGSSKASIPLQRIANKTRCPSVQSGANQPGVSANIRTPQTAAEVKQRIFSQEGQATNSFQALQPLPAGASRPSGSRVGAPLSTAISLELQTMHHQDEESRVAERELLRRLESMTGLGRRLGGWLPDANPDSRITAQNVPRMKSSHGDDTVRSDRYGGTVVSGLKRFKTASSATIDVNEDATDEDEEEDPESLRHYHAGPEDAVSAFQRALEKSWEDHLREQQEELHREQMAPSQDGQSGDDGRPGATISEDSPLLIGDAQDYDHYEVRDYDDVGETDDDGDYDGGHDQGDYDDGDDYDYDDDY